MEKIIFKAKAGSVNIGDNEQEVTLEILKRCHGIDCQDDFAEYSDLEDKLNSGYMRFELEDGILYTITEYSVKEDLTDSEVEHLREETQGQWSDGIGEGFEQFPCLEIDGEEVYISPWYPNQIIETFFK